jgi:hypothetical protein
MEQIEAMELYGRLRGANCSRIMKCSDGNYYVTKNRNGQHGPKGLANELFASLLLKRLEISTPEPAIVNCSQEFLEQFELWRIQRQLPTLDQVSDNVSLPTWEPGQCFGSKVDLGGWRDIEQCPQSSYLPEPLLRQTKNLREFVDVLVFDTWCRNVDDRQAVFMRPKGWDGFKAYFIDHGQCFTGRRWNLAIGTNYVAYRQSLVYDSVFGLDAFEDVMLKIRDRCSVASLREIAAEIPAGWYAGEEKALEGLLFDLSARRKVLPFLLDEMCSQKPNPFKNWSSDWKLHPQNAFLKDSFVRISVPHLPRKKAKSAA